MTIHKIQQKNIHKSKQLYKSRKKMHNTCIIYLGNVNTINHDVLLE